MYSFLLDFDLLWEAGDILFSPLNFDIKAYVLLFYFLLKNDGVLWDYWMNFVDDCLFWGLLMSEYWYGCIYWIGGRLNK